MLLALADASRQPFASFPVPARRLDTHFSRETVTPKMAHPGATRMEAQPFGVALWQSSTKSLRECLGRRARFRGGTAGPPRAGWSRVLRRMGKHGNRAGRK